MVHIPTTHPTWQEVAIKESEWTSQVRVIEANLNEIYCIMVQLMIE